MSFIQRQTIEQAKFSYSLLPNAFEKETEKHIDTIKSLEISKKKDKLKQTEIIFLQNLMNDIICAKLKEILELQGIIKKDDLNYKLKRRKAW